VFKIGSRAQPADLAAAITAILSDEDLRQRLSEGARRYADEVSFEKIVDRFWQEVILAS